ncbi:alpha/beta hydrolase, partial [Rhodobacteraceae bacterium]|nr:alpha/beta hydrolase [Paracoccaceae bacterium]
VDVPVLLIEGAASHPSAGAVNTALQNRLPQTQRAVIDGAGHMVPITHAAETAQAIDGFWADTI